MAHVILNASDKLFNELHSSAHFLFESPSPTFSSMISIEHSTDQIIFENRTTENPGENDNAVIYDVPSVIVVLILLLIIAGTVIGNVLVCVAVCMVKKLRRPYNYLLVSLAFSDLCVAILVMPVALLNELWGGWAFGPLICDIWVSFDVLSCTASILNLCMISVDRYLAITKPLEYGVKRTPRRMCAYIAIVWIGAGFVSVPPVLILGNEHGMDGNRCDVCQNFYYQVRPHCLSLWNYFR
ncbi:G protein-coupled receptor rhodopsin-like [Trinorchestia longiramus]|nr:G protein-coupled receptor rhodopsin-like [Trinorchestia longiramus]